MYRLMTNPRRLALAAAMMPVLWAGAASAATATLTLTQFSLTNVTDAAGVNQYEAGPVTNSRGAMLGYYNITRRVTNGFSQALNTAAETITLVLAPSDTSPLQNITLEGSHSYDTGNFIGSVSAASSKYHFTIGGSASATIGSNTQLTMTWKSATPFP